MARKIFFICVWTVVFFFGSAGVLGLASGLYFAMSDSFGQEPSDQTMAWIAMSWLYGGYVLGSAGLVLGILGLLPGTRRKSS